MLVGYLLWRESSCEPDITDGGESHQHTALGVMTTSLLQLMLRNASDASNQSRCHREAFHPMAKG